MSDGSLASRLLVSVSTIASASIFERKRLRNVARCSLPISSSPSTTNRTFTGSRPTARLHAAIAARCTITPALSSTIPRAVDAVAAARRLERRARPALRVALGLHVVVRVEQQRRQRVVLDEMTEHVRMRARDLEHLDAASPAFAMSSATRCAEDGDRGIGHRTCRHARDPGETLEIGEGLGLRGGEGREDGGGVRGRATGAGEGVRMEGVYPGAARPASPARPAREEARVGGTVTSMSTPTEVAAIVALVRPGASGRPLDGPRAPRGLAVRQPRPLRADPRGRSDPPALRHRRAHAQPECRAAREPSRVRSERPRPPSIGGPRHLDGARRPPEGRASRRRGRPTPRASRSRRATSRRARLRSLPARGRARAVDRGLRLDGLARSRGWSSACGPPDPLARHAAGIVEHMNRDHPSVVAELAKFFAKTTGSAARVTALDSRGFDVEVTRGVRARRIERAGPQRVRIPFPAPATTPTPCARPSWP